MNDDNARNAEVEERSTILKRRFGNQLNAEQMDEVAKGTETTVDLSLALREFQLDYSDEPPSLFQPYRKEG